MTEQYLCAREDVLIAVLIAVTALRFTEGKYVHSRGKFRLNKKLFQNIMSNHYLNDVFTENREYVSNFCSRYKEEVGYPFELNTRVEHLTPEMLQSLKDAGCYRVAMGIEQGDEKFRKEILNRRMSNEKIEKAFELTKKAGIRTKSFNIVGFPFETYDIHMETVKINRKVQPSSLVIYVFEPYPGTPLYEMCQKIILLKTDRIRFYIRTDTTLNMPDFTRKQIQMIQKFAWKSIGKSIKDSAHRIYYSNMKLLIRLLTFKIVRLR
jgi:radical SAM superfamily enzyme YgiQ (UPF0313 family)